MSGITIAVLVGIEDYADPGVAPTLKAPALDAVRMALKMPQIGVRPEHTFLFLQPRKRDGTEQHEYQQVLQSLHADVKPPRTCEQQVLSRFWRDELQKLQAANPGSRLLFYWSGHGFSDANAGVPLLLCHDYTSKLTDRVVDREELLRQLHSVDYENLGSQLLLFDACANNVPTGGIPGTANVTWSKAVDQASIAAAPRGVYAHGDETGGQFTRVLLDALGACDTWPDPLAFWTDLKPRLEAANMSSATVSLRYGGPGVADELLHVGTITEARAELEKALGNLQINVSDYLVVYRWVTDALSPEPTRGKAADIRGILRDLWDAGGAVGSAQAPYPVVEFVARLLKHFPNAAPLQQWLNEEAYVRKSDIGEAAKNLSAEEKMLILEVEIVEGTSTRPGEIVAFSARLFRFDRVTNVSPASWVNPQPVTPADDFKTLLIERLRQAHAIATDYQTSLTVEFLTNLFNIAPHQLDSVADGGLLPTKFGGDHPVLLRWRGRNQQSVERRTAWIDRTERIRSGKVAVPVHPLSDTSAVPDCRVVFVRYALKSESGPGQGRPATSEWRTLFHSIQSGVPFVCWICDGSEDVPAGEKVVAAWFDKARQLAQIPLDICSQRAPDSIASAINVFWDDPLTTYQLREIRVGQKP